jgi:pimeloyl-ACP methyl ester carboxylesterase
VLRYDIRGFGRSTPMPLDHQWSIGELMDDINGLMDHLSLKHALIVGGKSGGTIAMKYAIDNPDRVTKLALAGAPVKGPNSKPWLDIIESRGVQAWASETMPGRFGTMLAPEAIQWWTGLMAKTPKTTLQGYLRWVPGVDIEPEVKNIRCPTLVIAADGGPLHKVEETAGWQRTIPDSELRAVSGDGWHACGAKPDECAAMALEFFRRR